LFVIKIKGCHNAIIVIKEIVFPSQLRGFGDIGIFGGNGADSRIRIEVPDIIAVNLLGLGELHGLTG